MKRHKHKEIREAVKAAVAAGWTLEEPGKSAHVWGKLYCGRVNG